MATVTGGELLVRTLLNAGVRQVFGLHGIVGTRSSGARYHDVTAAFGCEGWHVVRLEELGPTIREAFASRRPACINVETGLAPIPPELHLLTAR